MLLLLAWLFILAGIVISGFLLLLILFAFAFLLVYRPTFLVLDPVLCSIEYISPAWWLVFWMSKVIILQVVLLVRRGFSV